jgi:hypothetical protein
MLRRDGGLEIQPGTGGDPTRQEYITTLLQADMLWSHNRFLRLPPELRVEIWRSLLRLDDTGRCHPQIMRAAGRELYHEMNYILYCENVFVITVWEYGVYAFREGCGLYRPELPDAGYPRMNHSSHLRFPDFLRRARSIRLDIRRLQPPNQLSNALSGASAVHNIMFVLCAHLRFSTALRILSVNNLGGFRERCISEGISEAVEPYLRQMLYPLRLLPGEVHVHVDGASAATTATPIAFAMAMDIISGGSKWIAMKYIFLACHARFQYVKPMDV